MRNQVKWATMLGLTFQALGCAAAAVKNTDRSVYELIHDRQREALGTTSNVALEPSTNDGASHTHPRDQMYSFTPHPADPGVPESFQSKTRLLEEESVEEEPVETDESAGSGSEEDQLNGEAVTADTVASNPRAADGGSTESDEMSPSIFTAEELEEVEVFALSDALRYAMRHARDVQDAKEVLYLGALNLTLERHLWTPQFGAEVNADYENLGQLNNFDQALTAVAEVAVTQRLPLGGEIAARAVDTLVRDISEHVTTGESGRVILEANLPLFRGAGHAAYESRYAAERALIYAVRTYERFRRTFAVQVSGSYFDLQQRKASIVNAHKSYLTRRADWVRADFMNRVGRSQSVFDASRALSSLRSAEVALVSAKESYATALDRFKVLVGMPLEVSLDVVSQEEDVESEQIDNLLPNVDSQTATEVALTYRLDLLTEADRVDDARRGVVIAKNRILPDLDLSGSVTSGSDPEHVSTTGFNLERTTWSAGAVLRIDDRKRERNEYRASLISLRQSERNFELASDIVRADVRSALRRIEQSGKVVEIQALNVEENTIRYEAAKAQSELGKINNRDVVEADTDLLRARNELAAAVADYRDAILEFRRDTGTLRITDDGEWGQSAVQGQP